VTNPRAPVGHDARAELKAGDDRPGGGQARQRALQGARDQRRRHAEQPRRLVGVGVASQQRAERFGGRRVHRSPRSERVSWRWWCSKCRFGYR
jgi:hypothetical protein